MNTAAATLLPLLAALTADPGQDPGRDLKEGPGGQSEPTPTGIPAAPPPPAPTADEAPLPTVFRLTDDRPGATPVLPPQAPPTSENSELRLRAGRHATLSDGGIDAGRSAHVAPQTETDLFGPGLAAGSAEFQVYDLGVQWAAWSAGPIRLDFATGLRAVRADYTDTATFSDDPRFRPVPVVGTELRWDVSRGFYVTGGALGHAVQTQADMLDLKAEAGFSILPKVDLSIGYQYLRSSVDVGPFDTTLRQEGPFARLQIRF